MGIILPCYPSSYHPLPPFNVPNTAFPGLCNPSAASCASLSISFFLFCSSSFSFLHISSLFHTMFPAPPLPCLATGSSCPSGVHGLLTFGIEFVGGAVDSAGVSEENVPSFCRDLGWNQLPAPPRPVCAYSCEAVWEGCIDADEVAKEELALSMSCRDAQHKVTRAVGGNAYFCDLLACCSRLRDIACSAATVHARSRISSG